MSFARRSLKMTALAAVFAALLPAAQSFANGAQQQGLARSQMSVNEEAVSRNRAVAIQQIVNMWPSAMQNAAATEQFRMTLDAATNRQLAKILTATSFDQVRDVLLGKLAGSVDRVGILSLGDTSSDLVFTPVNPPCRIFDTRNYAPFTPPGPATFRNYLVYGTGAQMAAQGGNAAGCPAPKGEPVGISANFTAVPTATGHLRVYPFGGALPTVSFLNFTAGVNIANAGIVSTCYLCAADLTVYNAATTHHVADVMGYFYPAPIDFADSTALDSFTVVAGANYGIDPTSVTPSHNGKCLVTTHGQIFADGADTYSSTFFRTARQIGAGAPVDDSMTGLYLVPVAGRFQTTVASASYVWDVVAGTTYRFGCYMNSGGDLVGNSGWCRTTRICF